MAVGTRSYVANSYLLRLDAKDSGFLDSVEGGEATAEVVHETGGTQDFVKKHIGAIKYEPFTMQFGLSMAKPVYDWIAASWKMDSKPKTGSIIALDYNLEPKGERAFFDAIVTETTIPTMDGASKDPCNLTVKIGPATTVAKKTTEKVTGELGKAQQKVWVSSNFRLEIDDLDCTKVAKIDSFTVKQTVVSDPVGAQRDYSKQPGRVEFPNLRITLSEAGAQSWIDWHKSFVVDGNHGENYEKNGSLVFLAPNLQSELGRISFFNLGIFKLRSYDSGASADSSKRIVAELYCERMEFKI